MLGGSNINLAGKGGPLGAGYGDSKIMASFFMGGPDYYHQHQEKPQESMKEGARSGSGSNPKMGQVSDPHLRKNTSNKSSNMQMPLGGLNSVKQQRFHFDYNVLIKKGQHS